jgi:hypothetical protein
MVVEWFQISKNSGFQDKKIKQDLDSRKFLYWLFCKLPSTWLKLHRPPTYSIVPSSGRCIIKSTSPLDVLSDSGRSRISGAGATPAASASSFTLQDKAKSNPCRHTCRFLSPLVHCLWDFRKPINIYLHTCVFSRGKEQFTINKRAQRINAIVQQSCLENGDNRDRWNH